MRFKIDENLGVWAAQLLLDAGHDACTVPDQNLQGHPDTTIIQVCRDEYRCLITLDVEFANPLLFPPAQYRGIVLLRVHPRAERQSLVAAVHTLADAVRQEQSAATPDPIDGKLWIVEPGRVRVYQPSTDQNDR